MNLKSYGVSKKGEVMFFILNNYSPYQMFETSNVVDNTDISSCSSLINLLHKSGILFKEGRGKYSHKFGGNEFLAIYKISEYLKDRPYKSKFSVSYLINTFSNVCNAQSIWRAVNFLNVTGCIKKIEKGRYIIDNRSLCSAIYQWLFDRHASIQEIKSSILQKTETSVDRARLKCYEKYFENIDYSVFKDGCNLFCEDNKHIGVITPQINSKSYVIYEDSNIPPLSIIWSDITSVRYFVNNVLSTLDFITDKVNAKIWSKAATFKKIEAENMLSDIINEGYSKQIKIKVK